MHAFGQSCGKVGLVERSCERLGPGIAQGPPRRRPALRGPVPGPAGCRRSWWVSLRRGRAGDGARSGWVSVQGQGLLGGGQRFTGPAQVPQDGAGVDRRCRRGRAGGRGWRRLGPGMRPGPPRWRPALHGAAPGPAGCHRQLPSAPARSGWIGDDDGCGVPVRGRRQLLGGGERVIGAVPRCRKLCCHRLVLSPRSRLVMGTRRRLGIAMGRGPPRRAASSLVLALHAGGLPA